MQSHKGGRASTALISTLALTLMLAAPVMAQEQTPAKDRQETIDVIHLQNTPQGNPTADLTTALRNSLGPKVKVYSDVAVVIRGTAEEIEQGRKIVAELDRPVALHRITFTITQSEDGKRTGQQRYSLLAAAGQKVDLREGHRVPILTGKYDKDSSGPDTQFQYVDVGLSINADFEGSTLRSKIEESAISDEKSSAGIQDPVIRQIALQSVTTITPGKPAVLGSLDIPNSTRHQEVEVLVERVQ